MSPVAPGTTFVQEPTHIAGQGTNTAPETSTNPAHFFILEYAARFVFIVCRS